MLRMGVVEQSELSRARHDLRGRVNALKMCLSALMVSETPEEKIEFLDLIVSESEFGVASLDAFNAASANEEARGT